MSRCSPNVFHQWINVYRLCLTRCRMYVVAYYIMCAMWNKSTMVNSKEIQILYYFFTLQCMVQLSIICKLYVGHITYIDTSIPAQRVATRRGGILHGGVHMYLLSWRKTNFFCVISILSLNQISKLINLTCLHFIGCRSYTKILINHASYQILVNALLPSYQSI